MRPEPNRESPAFRCGEEVKYPRPISFVVAAVVASIVAAFVNVIPMSGGLALTIAGLTIAALVIVLMYLDDRHRDARPGGPRRST